MKHLAKRTLSLLLAALLVLSLVPVMSLTAKAEDFTPGQSWTIASGYTSLIQGAFTPTDEDFVYEADETLNWRTWIVTARDVTGLQSKATLVYNGQSVVKTATGINATKGKNLQLWTPGSFPEITAEMYGNFELTVEIYFNSAVIVAGVLKFVRNEPAPEEPEAPAVPTKPGEVLWQYGKSSEGVGYEWLQGAIATENVGGIYKGWDPYDWAITLSPIKADATITVEAQIEDHTGTVIGTTTKNVEVGKAPAVTTILTAGDLGLSNKTLGNFRVTAVIKFNGEAIAQVQFVFGRRIGDAGYTAVEYLPGNEWITGKFTAADEDMTYVGNQKYDWKATIAPTKSAATVDVAVTVVNAQGETVATLNKTGVECNRGTTTPLVTAGEIAELTTDLYGQFAVNCIMSVAGKAYTGIYGVIERVEGEFVPDTVAPEFGPANWENCGLPAAVTVTNNGEINKQIQVKISIADAQGAVLVSRDVTHTVGAGASGELVTSNQMRQFVTERGATYYVVIEGRWTNGYDVYDINETLTYIWAEHTETEVIPGYAATCTKAGLTDGLFCNGCYGMITEQQEILPTGEHVYADCIEAEFATCTHEGYAVLACSCGETITEIIPITDHELDVLEEEIPAGCEEAGQTAVYYCYMCENIIEGGEVIPPLGHTPAEAVRENEIPATTLAEGSYDEVVYCDLCGAELSRNTIIVEKLPAEETTIVSVFVSQDTLYRGDTVTVTVSISPLENCAAGGFLFDFDTDVFEYVSGEALVSGFSSAGVSTINSRVAGYFMDGNETVKGSIFQITLRVKDTAAFADTVITGIPSLEIKVGDIKEHISCEADVAAVTVACNHSYGEWTPIDPMWEKRICSICGNEETQLITYNVIFQYADGTVISEAQYHYGDTVVVPDAPPALEVNNAFVGWDMEVDVCTGDTVYTAVFVEYILGDMDGNGIVDYEDAVYLLLNIMFGSESYPLSYAPADIDCNGTVDYDDPVYLLLHTLFGNVIYPLNNPSV